MLGLRSGLILLLLLLLLLNLLRFGFWLLFLGGLFLLGLLLLLGFGRLILDSLVDELEFVDNGGVDGLIVDSFVPASYAGVLLSPLLIEEKLEAAGNDAGCEEIC